MVQGKAEALEKVVLRGHQNITGIVVLKDGKTVYENYFNGCTAASRVHVYSVTKSIVSILIGMALDRGFIKSTDQKVLEFFPEYEARKGETAIQAVTLQHLLTMTAPFRHPFDPFRYVKYFTSDDWVKFSLDRLGGREKPGRFCYAPLIGPDILCGILCRAAGQPVLEFAKENLFAPLGIAVEKSIVFSSKEEQLAFNRATNISGWVADPMGVNTAGWGLTLSAMDMAKIGQLYLDRGVWNGRQLVPENWVAESTREHSRWKARNLPYGYLWWVNQDGFAAMGDGGNVIWVNTRKRLVAAITALFRQKADDRVGLIQTHIEPMFDGIDNIDSIA